MSTAILTEDQVHALAKEITRNARYDLSLLVIPWGVLEQVGGDFRIVRLDHSEVIFQGDIERCGDFLMGFKAARPEE